MTMSECPVADKSFIPCGFKQTPTCSIHNCKKECNCHLGKSLFKVDDFVDLLLEVKGENLFNPYTDKCPHNDLELGPVIRTNNLVHYLRATEHAKVLLVGEAPGYLGCRRTGLSFTDERHLKIAHEKFGYSFQMATFQGKDKEISALHVWEVLKELDEQPMVWNIVPMHPHKPDNDLSNRTPTGKDFEACKEVIEYLFRRRAFDTIIAIGNKAYDHLTKLGVKNVVKVRHPSHGGSNIFKSQLREIFGIEKPKLDDFF